MSNSIEVHRTYKYRLYDSDENFRLHHAINVSGIIWNHITALQKRYYRRFHEHISQARMKEHIAKLRMKTQRFQFWRAVGSQAVQNICERHHTAYQRFFDKKGGLPRFKKVKKYKSFTLKQASWKIGEDTHQRGGARHPKWTGHIILFDIPYKFVKHRPMIGNIKTVTIKRDAAQRLWVCFSVVEKICLPDETDTSKIGGFDFGLKTFITADNGTTIKAPQFYLEDLPHLRQIQSQVSKKVSGSANQSEGQKHIARRHIRIAEKRRDFHFKLAHKLCQQYNVLVFEDLNIHAMKQRWGRKISDLGFAKFIEIIKWIAIKQGKHILLIDRWALTTSKCSGCGHQQKLSLKDRIFACKQCTVVLDRDHNAAKNIFELGHQLILSQSEKTLKKQRGLSDANGSQPY